MTGALRARYLVLALVVVVLATGWIATARDGSKDRASRSAPEPTSPGPFAAAPTSTVSPNDTTLRAGIPANLVGGWVIRTFDGEPIRWDPRIAEGFGFVMGPPGVVVFEEDGCSQTRFQVAFDSGVMTVNRASVSGIEGSCIAELGFERLPIRAFLTGGDGTLDYSLVEGVLTLRNVETASVLTAQRGDTIDEPLPADLTIPAALYGRWRVDAWSNGNGQQTGDNRDPNLGLISFQEFASGPLVAYNASCNGTTVEIESVDAQVIHLADERSSTLMGCSGEGLPVLDAVFSGDQVRYEVTGDRLVLRDPTARSTVTAVRVSER